MDNKAVNKYIYGEESNINLKLVVAIRRGTQPNESALLSIVSEYGLTLSQFGVLESLYHIGPMCINQILEKTLSTSGNMTVVIKNLVKSGMITKSRDPQDGRSFIISLTDEGHRIIDELFPKHLKELNEVFSSLDMEEKGQLLDLLKKLNRYESKKKT